MVRSTVPPLRSAAWCALLLLATLPFPTGAVVTASTPASAPTFTPVPSVVIAQPGTSARTVADSQGVFHAVVDAGNHHEIVYQRSSDGGRTWAPAARFQGEHRGAKDAVIAVAGDRLAIGYIGGWCDPSVVDCIIAEVPYLVTSLDGGRSWGNPVRLANAFTSDIQVAVDDERVWVAFTSAKLELRGTTDGGRTFFASRSLSAYYRASLSAADRVMVLAYNGLDAPRGPVVPRAVVADVRTLGATQDLPAGWGLGGWQSSTAAAEGRVQVLLRNDTTKQFAVVSADKTGVFSPPVQVGTGYSASIAARRGSVGVAVGDDDGITSMRMSADGGLSFSAAVPVSSTAGNELLVALGAAQVATDRPMARFDWSVPDRFVDEDGDGLPEPANFSGDPALDGLRVHAGRTVHVSLDACGSRFGPGRSPADYSWFVDGNLHASGMSCQTTLDVQDGDAPSVRLEIRNDLGETDTTTQEVAPRDLLVVSIGDSIASGEGSPHVDATAGPEVWRDGPCHRSAYAGPSLAAQQLEQADRRSSVTFIQLACSGAAMLDVPEQPGSDDPATGGLLDTYHGVEPTPTSLRPSQLDQLVDLAGTRPVDALLVSIGANDAKFSDVITGCIVTAGCQTGAVRDGFDQRAAELPSRYARLADAIIALGVRSADVYLTEYFDPTIDDFGLPALRCVGQSAAVTLMADFLALHPGPVGDLAAIVSALQHGGLLDDDEARWAHEGVMGALNVAARDAASAHGWTYVGGIAQRFDRHGYCATDPWVVRLGESVTTQDDQYGSFHPNRAGQRVYGNALFASLRTHVLTSDGTYDPGALSATDIGDFVVLTSTDEAVTAASVHSTGGAPLPGAVRLLDTAQLASGYLGVGGPPAVGSSAAAGAWLEVAHTDFSVDSVTARAAQLFVHPNAAVQSVAIVQAPGNAATMVADRASVVMAEIDADVSGPTPLQATVVVTATDIAGGRRTLVDTVETVTATPGHNTVLLPKASTFTAAELEHVDARVEITDPPGAGPNDALDNIGYGVADAATSRQLDLAIGPADLGPASVTCATVQATGQRMVAYARQAMPVSAAGIDARLACTPIVAPLPNDAGVLNALLYADELARYIGADAFVLIVPDGWLQAAAGGALGVSAHGMRAAIVEASATDAVLSHELSHTFGIGDAGLVPASGARVDRREPRKGVDWMAWQAQPKMWTGGGTWDRLLAGLGGPENAPEPLDQSGTTGTWVRGTVSRLPDGTWAATQGRWVSGPAGPASTIGPEALNLQRMTATQLDANGNPIGEPTPVGLGAAGGQYGTAAGPTQPDAIGFAYAARLTIAPDAASIELRLDGQLVDMRPLTAAPTVTVTAPAAGDVIARGAPLTVTWTASDPDGDPLTSSVLISDDGGSTFRPLAMNVIGTSLTLPLPADVGGNQVVVRVVTSDGVRQAFADSGVFTTPLVGLPEERVVFTTTAFNYPLGRYVGGLFTMRPDGSEVQRVPLPDDATYRAGDVAAPRCSQPGDCDVEYRSPAWGPDGRIYFASTLRTPQFGATDPGDAWTGSYDITGTHIFSVNPDGTDLQRVTDQSYDPSWWPLSDPARSNGDTTDFQCPAPSPAGDAVAWYTNAPGNPGGIWTSTRAGAEWARPVAAFSSGAYPSSLLPAGSPTPIDWTGNGPQDDVNLSPTACARWSPDGSAFAVVATISYGFQINGQSRTLYGGAIVEAAADGSNLRIAAIAPDAADPTVLINALASVDWRSGGEFLVSMIGHPESDLNRYAAFSVDRTSGAFTRLTAEPDARYFERPWKLKISPAGSRWYGELPNIVGVSSTGEAPIDLGVVDPATGGPERVAPAFDPPSLEANTGFDWAFVAPPAAPALSIDPDAAPNDPNAPAEPTGALVPPSTEPSPGAADVEGPSGEPLGDTSVTITAGETTRVVVLGAGGVLVPFVVVPTASSPIVVTAAAGGSSLALIDPPTGQPTFGITSAPDGSVLLSAIAGFAGTAAIQVAPIANPPAVSTVTVDVILANLAPVAVDDVVTATAGEESILDPLALVGNDRDPDGTAPQRIGSAAAANGLELVAVHGATDGRAWLDVDGNVHVRPSAAGTSTFAYVVADAGGATAGATVTVIAAPAPTTTTTTTTATTTTAPATTVTDVVSPTPPATTTPILGVPVDVGALPNTGASITLTLVVAGLLIMIGLYLRGRSRRATPAS